MLCLVEDALPNVSLHLTNRYDITRKTNKCLIFEQLILYREVSMGA